MWTAVLVTAALLSGGCAGRQAEQDLVPRHPSKRPEVAGYSRIDRYSPRGPFHEDWSSGPARYFRHVYTGVADKTEVRKPYHAQIPVVGWTPLGEDQMSGRHVLRFKRQGESCTIRLADGTVRWTQTVEIEVLIAPSAE